MTSKTMEASRSLAGGRLVLEDGELYVGTSAMRLRPLTSKQKQVLVAIAQVCRRTAGVPPTVRDIAAMTGISSTSTKYTLDALTRFGLLVREGNSKGQTWRLLGSAWEAPDWIPVVAANVGQLSRNGTGAA